MTTLASFLPDVILNPSSGIPWKKCIADTVSQENRADQLKQSDGSADSKAAVSPPF